MYCDTDLTSTLVFSSATSLNWRTRVHANSKRFLAYLYTDSTCTAGKTFAPGGTCKPGNWDSVNIICRDDVCTPTPNRPCP